MSGAKESANERAEEAEAAEEPALSLVGDAATRREERLPLRWGKLLQVTSEDDHEHVVLLGKTGRVELTLEITESGAKVVVDAEDLALRAKRKLSVTCDTFEVDARRFDVRATESAGIEAPDASVHATEGDLSLRANDDVKVNGERVLLNSDGDVSVPDWMQKELGAKRAVEEKIAAADVSGDEALLREFEAGKARG
jgi:hypothetical protein